MPAKPCGVNNKSQDALALADKSAMECKPRKARSRTCADHESTLVPPILGRLQTIPSTRSKVDFENLEFTMLALLTAALLSLQAANADRFAGDDTKGSLDMEMVASLHDVPVEANSFTTELIIGEDITGKLVVQANSLKTGIGMRDSKMYEYCLETDKYPTVTFEMRGVTGDAEGLKSKKGTGKIKLHGKLTVRSTTRDIAVPTTYTWKDEQLHLKGTAELKWTDYGVPDPSILISTLYPEIKLSFDLALDKAF